MDPDTAGSRALVRPGSTTALRELNRQRMREALQQLERATQADLARATGLAPATVSSLARELRDAGEVVDEVTPGRRRILRLADRSGFVIGVDYGHRHVTVAVADLDHQVLAQHRTELGTSVLAADGLAVTADLTERALRTAGVDRHEIVGAAMGLPAPIDRRTGCVGSPSILPGWVGVDASELATSVLGLPVRVTVDNDANLGALAEHRWGAGVGVSDMAYLKLSDGVGAGLIVDGRLYSGITGTAGEIGHVTVDEFGDVCRCGNRGCLETLVSARRVVSLLAPLVDTELTITEIVARAERGERSFWRVLHDVGRQVGRSLADLCSLLNPQLVLIGGELAQAATILVPAIEQTVQRCGVPAAAHALRIAPATLGARAHVLGAVARAEQSAIVFTS
ncbi:ROK family transcriptional regulator [Antrihabitans cavernicola]|uniref:ROK family transcriptional regulator n=1 Tax=Antrihabitans cavernicola TaxID=2495913 RepID=A0A5A7S882_9NOCA|nr:ROK family transcriptional regulator [Spelaeibacter cavernicola]KAA0020084.1 ROK family transcriptional regulator [Spelaeibacter cavernicola]